MLLLNYPRIRNTQDLKTALQNAIRLEHSTIPPYLTAWWTLKESSPGAVEARDILFAIAMDEMRHMLMMCNLLNAIGGAPVVNQSAFIPRYPDVLPMTIGTTEGGPFRVGLRRYSRTLVHDAFMVIESPEEPIEIEVGPRAAFGPIEDHYRTIGEFYQAVADVITEAGPSLFSTPSSPQVEFFGVTAISDVQTAVNAIEIIKVQGEGTPASPLSTPSLPAHYYRFESLYRGMALKVEAGRIFFDPNSPVVVDDVADVIQMVDDPGQADLSGDPEAQLLAARFDEQYRAVLNKLQEAVSGQPRKISASVAIMHGLSSAAEDVLAHQITAGPHAGQFLGPRFQLP